MAFSSILRKSLHNLRLSTCLRNNLGNGSVIAAAFKRFSTNVNGENESIIAIEEMHRFMKDCMLAVGCTETDANQLAATLVHADHRGHYSHGLNRLGNISCPLKIFC